MLFRPRAPKNKFIVRTYETPYPVCSCDGVSADGMVLTEEEWIPGRESEKAVLVYEKQS